MIRGGQLKSASATHLTPQEIAKQTHSIEGEYVTNDIWDNYGVVNNGYTGKWNGCGFAEPLRDTTNGILIRWATDILRDDHTIEPSFIMSKNIILVRYIGDYPNRGEGDQYFRDHLDTIAYIPNAIMDRARDLIFAAHANEQWQEIYNIFNEDFKFVPITGAEYKALGESN